MRETADIARADLVVYERGFQPAVDAGVEQSATGEVLDATDVGLEKDARGPPRPALLAGPGPDGRARRPRRRGLARSTRPTPTPSTPTPTALRRQLTALDTAYAEGLADCARHTVVVSHEAFGYLAKYGLRLEPVAGLSPDAEPTPADLARLQELIADRRASPRSSPSGWAAPG